MRLGLITDTHIPEVTSTLPPEVLLALQGVDLILHAGDIYQLSVLDELAAIAPVMAARGDDDYGEVVHDQRVQTKHVLKLGERTLWLVHEKPLHLTAAWPMDYPHRADGDLPDIVVFGHEHRVVVQRHNGILFINSGSPTCLNYQRGLGTMGILDISSGDIAPRIIDLRTGVDTGYLPS